MFERIRNQIDAILSNSPKKRSATRVIKQRSYDGIVYTIRNYRRSKSVRIMVKSGPRVIITKPAWVTIAQAESFLAERIDWVRNHLTTIADTPGRLTGSGTAQDLRRNRGQALKLVHAKIERFNAHYQFRIGRISIRNQSTRWGSCSSHGNLNFNYNIINLPDELADYLVVHELCHLREMNHSQRFWDLVGETIPNYHILRKQLKMM